MYTPELAYTISLLSEKELDKFWEDTKDIMKHPKMRDFLKAQAFFKEAKQQGWLKDLENKLNEEQQ